MGARWGLTRVREALRLEPEYVTSQGPGAFAIRVRVAEVSRRINPFCLAFTLHTLGPVSPSVDQQPLSANGRHPNSGVNLIPASRIVLL